MHSNGSVVTISELERGEGRASISNNIVEIDVAGVGRLVLELSGGYHR